MSTKSIVESLSTKLNMSDDEIETLLSLSSSALETIRNIEKTDLYQLHDFDTSAVGFLNIKLLGQYLIDKIRRPIKISNEELEEFKQEIIYESIQIFSEPIYKLLNINDDIEKSFVASSYRSEITNKIEDAFSIIFKESS